MRAVISVALRTKWVKSSSERITKCLAKRVRVALNASRSGSRLVAINSAIGPAVSAIFSNWYSSRMSLLSAATQAQPGPAITIANPARLSTRTGIDRPFRLVQANRGVVPSDGCVG